MARKVAKVGKEVDASKVKRGDLMAFTLWAKVDHVRALGQHLELTNVDNDEEFQVQGEALVEDGKSADQYSRTETLPKTKVVEVLVNAKNVPMTVKFVKKDGSLRVLRGRVIGVDQKNLGYIDVEDLDLDEGTHRLRLVDARTIEFVIVGGVKYISKG